MKEIKSVENRITVSVIVPVYNTAPWIGRCIESLKAQEQEGLEFLFIDDCSTDDSLAYVEAFAKEDPRVQVMKNQVNLGAGPTRNRGIESARGEYLSFIDPDDWISKDFYMVLYAKAKETGSDIVKGRREYVDEEGMPLYAQRKSALNRGIDRCLKRGIPIYTVFTYEHQSAIYKSSLVKKENIRYGNSRKSQDKTFLLSLCRKSEDIQICNDAIYYYFSERAGSAVNALSIKRALGDFNAVQERLDIILKDPINKDALLYIQKDISICISVLFYISPEGHLTEDPVEIQSLLRSQILRVREQDALCKNIPEIKAFLDYDFLIPSQKTLVSDALFSDGVLRWVEFIITHPNVNEAFVMNGLASAFTYSTLLYYKALLFNGLKKTPNLIESRNRIKEHWSRLDKKTRCQVLLRMSKEGPKRLLRKLHPFLIK